MGVPGLQWYGNAYVGSALEDVEKVVTKIKSNDFSAKDLVKLYNANAELLKAILNNDYKN